MTNASRERNSAASAYFTRASSRESPFRGDARPTPGVARNFAGANDSSHKAGFDRGVRGEAGRRGRKERRAPPARRNKLGRMRPAALITPRPTRGNLCERARRVRANSPHISRQGEAGNGLTNSISFTAASSAARRKFGGSLPLNVRQVAGPRELAERCSFNYSLDKRDDGIYWLT